MAAKHRFEQYYQDRMWKFYQIENTLCFNKSYPRLLYLVKQCDHGKRILNIGVGTGFLEEQLMNRRFEVYSLDPSEEVINMVQDRLFMGDRARVGHCNSIPFDDNFFDIVIMTEVLEHFNDDVLFLSLSEAYRVLAKGGVFIGTVPYKQDLKADMIFCPYCESKFHRWGHVQSFDKRDIKKLICNAGFRKISAITCAFPDWDQKGIKPFVKSLMRYALGRLGESIVNPYIYFKAYK